MNAAELRKYFISLIIYAVTAISVSALPPAERINYQGRLIDGTNLVNGSFPIVFRLYDDLAAGTELYGETQTVSVVDGLYTASIGMSNTVAGSLLSSLQDNVCFLEVEIGGTVLSPREEITAVAHALTAVNKGGDTMTGALTMNVGGNNDIHIDSLGSNISIGNSSSTQSGSERIALGHNVTNEIDNTAAVRGTLYLDGGTNIYYRSTAGSGAWQELVVEADPIWLSEKSGYATGTPLYVYTETDPVWTAEKSGYATGTPLYVETDPVWVAERSNYATGSPLYEYTEIDPSWTSSETTKVSKTGDDMSGALTINVGAENAIVIDSAGTNVAIGYQANAIVDGAAVGWKANGRLQGVAMGYNAFAYMYGVSLGYSSYGPFSGVAIGYDATGDSTGVAMGVRANGSGNGTAIGYEALGNQAGVALGRNAKADDRGVAAGRLANGLQAGISIGYDSRGLSTNIAIGFKAKTGVGSERIAIGHDVINDFDNSICVRGTLYLDGGTGVMYRSTFGDTNGWSVKAFTIDHPLDPKNKVLRHYSLEGPEVWNVYAGNAEVKNGRVAVELPAYYSALNRSGSEVYTFTPVGVPSVCYVKQKVVGRSFVIGADKDCEVSWSIKVLRNDPAALEDLKRRPVEQLKTEIPAVQPSGEQIQVNTTVLSP